MTPKRRQNANGEGSVYPYRGRGAGQSYVTQTDGRRVRRAVYGDTRRGVEKEIAKLLEAEEAGRRVLTANKDHRLFALLVVLSWACGAAKRSGSPRRPSIWRPDSCRSSTVSRGSTGSW